jgi:UDP-N-acetylmuramoyl-tripeptide--D-alanyl-D-alanine ligase
MNSLAVLLAAKAFGLDLETAAGALASFHAQPGRGERLILQAEGGPYTLLDESYNANPESMRAAFALAGALPIQEKARRIAILGDMLELGQHAGTMHAELATDIEAHGIDLVFAAGPMMKYLYHALPRERRGIWRESAADLEPIVRAAIRGGDIVIVKGSNGSKMSPIVAALKHSSLPQNAAPAKQEP